MIRELKSFILAVESDLDSFSKNKTGLLAKLSSYAMTGSGKRVRPGLVYLSSRFGSADEALVRETALAVEMIHIATLVHDDLVDDAFLRRQKPTAAVRFGEGAAVLLGDYIYAEAFLRLSRSRSDLLRLFSETTTTICAGELAQYDSRYRFDLTEQDYLVFLEKKTASLMAASCRAGGLLASLPKDDLDALDRFGHKAGVAFQIVDDVLDIEGDESSVGKTLLTDLTHGKMTLPLIDYAATLTSDKERQEFQDILRHPDERVAPLVKAVRRSGVLTRSRKRADALMAEALTSLQKLPAGGARSLLEETAQRLVVRQS